MPTASATASSSAASKRAVASSSLGGHLARRAAYPLGQRKGRVGLEVGEGGGTDQRVGVAVLGAERRDDGVAHPLRENLLWIGHT
jgi:hypothetical protein